MQENLQLAQQLNAGCLCELGNSISTEFDNTLSPHPYFLAKSDFELIRDFISFFDHLTQREDFRRLALEHMPAISRHAEHTHGVLDGYDFHVAPNGPKLIEVNTNAGGAYLNLQVAKDENTSCNLEGLSTFDCCESLPLTPSLRQYEQRLIDMFKKEHFLRIGESRLKTIVILDESPQQQFLYPEMQRFKTLFSSFGITTYIVDPAELSYRDGVLWLGASKVDLVYNRHTDFYLETSEMEEVRQAYLDNAITLTPHPVAYGGRADKRILALVSSQGFSRTLKLNQWEEDLLERIIPETQVVDQSNQDELWRTRKQWFFKPFSGFGSKGVYRGAKLTKNTWRMIVNSGYVAQRYVEPSKRIVNQKEGSKLLKADLRAYSYNGGILRMISRLYSGQATNLRTEGGGFSTVLVMEGSK